MRRAVPIALRASFVVAMLVACVSPAAAQDSIRIITLDEALQMAMSADPALVAVTGNEATARAEVRQAYASWLPNLTASSGYANSSNQRFDQATGQLVSESYTAQLSASVPIFTGGRRPLQQASANAQMRAAGANSRAQRFETSLATRRAFFEAAAADELLAAAGQRLDRATQQLEFAQTRLEVGTATRSDFLRAQLEVGNAELAVIDAETALRAARLALGRQVGLPEEVQPAPGALPEVAPPLPGPDALAELAAESAPDAVAALATRSARTADRRASYAAYLPSINASGGYDWFAFDFPPSDRSWSFRVFASIPIFNGLQRETAVARARAAEQTASATARDAVIAARNEAETARREVSAAERRVEIAQRAVQLAEEDLRVQTERYQLGNATILDLNTSQIALTDAEVEFVRSRQNLAVALAELESSIGIAIEDLTAGRGTTPAQTQRNARRNP